MAKNFGSVNIKIYIDFIKIKELRIWRKDLIQEEFGWFI